ncbi:type I restriction enzyme, S subunit [Nitrosomonas nitrosa]|uniref:Type I restriction enzyme, S subunit n=1 Tax=Nitrosomonas nitrosa TaxID=52442 RepID=A0A1I4T5L4_9PROT|nr:restriction endonuclease subunit S [Nitrosomonas nitrosa]SFM71969.1 type I restriction enzyme, S subunit [Nitrosomonas nitrosa]
MKVALKNLVEIKSGYSPSTFELMENGPIPYVKVEDMNNCTKYQNASREYCEDVDRSVPAGAIIFPKRGAAIMNNKVRITATNICMDTNMMAIIPNGKIQSEFLYYTITYEKLSRIADTSTIPQINNKHINPYKIHLPPLPEQKAISALLSTWDEAIEKTERLIQAKEANLKGQIQKLISQRCDSWLHIKPKKLFDTITEKNFPDEELLSVTQDRGVIPRSMLEGRVMSPDGTTASYKLIKRGDFAISLRSFQGGIEYSNYQGIISPAYTVLRPKIELNRDFYRLFFKSHLFIEKYLNLAVIGIRDGKQISIPDFLSIKIPVPPLEEQKEIAEALLICQHEIDLLKQLADKYKTQKRGLMQKMLTGEWRVKPEIVNQYMEA